MKQLRTFLTPPVFPDNLEKTVQAANFYLIARVAIVAILFSFPILLRFLTLSIAIGYFSLILLYLVMMQVARAGYPQVSGLVLGILSWLLTFNVGVEAGGIESSGFVGGALVVVILMIFLLGWQGGVAFAILSAIGGLILAWLETEGRLLEPKTVITPYASMLTLDVQLAVAAAAAYLTTKRLADAVRQAKLELVERQLAEKALSLTEQRYRRLVENLPNSAAILFDHDLRFVLVDGPEMVRAGYSKEQMEGKTLYEALPPEFAQLAEPNMRAVLAGKQFSAELPFAESWHTYHYVPLRDETGAVVLGLILAQNITEQRRLEQALQHYNQELEAMVAARTTQLSEAKEQIEAVIEHTRDAIALVQSNGDVQFTNPAFRAMFTEDATRAIERILWSVPEAQSIALVADGLIAAIEQRTQQALATRIQSPNGQERDIDLDLVPIKPEQERQRGMVVSAHDITQYKDLERLKERFVANAVHDLGAPIGALAIRVHLLKQAPERLEQHVKSLENQVQHLTNLLEDLSTLSQLDQGMMSLARAPTNLNVVVERVFYTYEPMALEKQQAIVLSLDATLPDVVLDSRQMERVVANLIANAVNYTSEHKAIRVRTFTQPPFLVFEVSDEGMGIPAENRAHIFDRFYRTDEARTTRASGTGLGLAIVKEIIELHGGSISVESQPQQGSTFTIRLPL